MGAELEQAAAQRGKLEQSGFGSVLRINARLQGAGMQNTPGDSESEQTGSEDESQV